MNTIKEKSLDKWRIIKEYAEKQDKRASFFNKKLFLPIEIFCFEDCAYCEKYECTEGICPLCVNNECCNGLFESAMLSPTWGDFFKMAKKIYKFIEING